MPVPWLDALADALAHDGAGGARRRRRGARARRRARPARRWSSRAHACAGSIGGGHLEFEATAHRARRARRRERRPARGSSAFRSPRGLASAAAASPRSRSRTVDAARERGSSRRMACARTGSPFALVTRVAARGRGRTVSSSPPTTCAARSATSRSIPARSASRARGLPAQRSGAALVRFARDERDAAAGACRARRPSPSSCSATATSGARSSMCSASCPRRSAGSMRAPPTFPRRVPDNVEIVGNRRARRRDRAMRRPARSSSSPRTAMRSISRSSKRRSHGTTGATSGLIGSKSKRAQFERRLAARGFRAVCAHPLPDRQRAVCDQGQASGRDRGGDRRGAARSSREAYARRADARARR